MGCLCLQDQLPASKTERHWSRDPLHFVTQLVKQLRAGFNRTVDHESAMLPDMKIMPPLLCRAAAGAARPGRALPRRRRVQLWSDSLGDGGRPARLAGAQRTAGVLLRLRAGCGALPVHAGFAVRSSVLKSTLSLEGHPQPPRCCTGFVSVRCCPSADLAWCISARIPLPGCICLLELAPSRAPPAPSCSPLAPRQHRPLLR